MKIKTLTLIHFTHLTHPTHPTQSNLDLFLPFWGLFLLPPNYDSKYNPDKFFELLEVTKWQIQSIFMLKTAQWIYS